MCCCHIHFLCFLVSLCFTENFTNGVFHGAAAQRARAGEWGSFLYWSKKRDCQVSPTLHENSQTVLHLGGQALKGEDHIIKSQWFREWLFTPFELGVTVRTSSCCIPPTLSACLPWKEKLFHGSFHLFPTAGLFS